MSAIKISTEERAKGNLTAIHNSHVEARDILEHKSRKFLQNQPLAFVWKGKQKRSSRTMNHEIGSNSAIPVCCSCELYNRGRKTEDGVSSRETSTGGNGCLFE